MLRLTGRAVLDALSGAPIYVLPMIDTAVAGVFGTGRVSSRSSPVSEEGNYVLHILSERYILTSLDPP
jgi:hypothetical protein